MKIKLPEHDHKLTNILKVLLFSLLMLLPFLDIGTRCGYVLLNKNAYQSYSGTTLSYEKKKTENVKTLLYENEDGQLIIEQGYGDFFIAGRLLGFNSFDFYGTAYLDEIYINEFVYSNVYFTFSYDNYSNSFTFFYCIGNGLDEDYIRFGVENIRNFEFDILIDVWEVTDTLITDKFVIDSPRVYYDYEETSITTLDNVFDYSIDKMANSPLYNWTQSTGVYTGVNAMTTGLGITTPLFAILITYWMFLTIIYIILDIVLSLFTFMTHIFTKKE